MAEKSLSERLRRAVKDNNLFQVKRLIQRTDIRNPDPGPRRYTSLAWAAVLGHEETFEYLLTEGHDDEELSKDVENNTILILLAELRPGATNPYYSTAGHPDLLGAAMRMAQLYYDRYPFILEWSNMQGKTALHVAALKGNEELVRLLCDKGADCDLTDNLGNTPLHYASAWGHIPVVQLLIERGCTFTARNHEGFTASDYAYSYNTMSVLQETARMQFEAKKSARRQVYQQASSRSNEWQDGRIRSGSGGSRTTASDSGDIDGFRMLPQLRGYASSSPLTSSASSSRLPPIPSHSSSNGSLSFSSPYSANASISASSINALASSNAASVLSPIANRVRERDAGAIAAYLNRNRSGSASTQSDSRLTNGTSNSSSPSPVPNGVPATTTSSSGLPFPLANRRLRPSASAAQLRTTTLPLPIVTTALDQQTPRSRSGTTPTSTRPNPSAVSPLDGSFLSSGTPLSTPRTLERRSSNRRAGILGGRPSDAEDYTGPSRDYAIFPEPPPHVNSEPPAVVSTKANIASARRAALALLSKPLPNVDQRAHREHRRVTSTSDTRT